MRSVTSFLRSILTGSDRFVDSGQDLRLFLAHDQSSGSQHAFAGRDAGEEDQTHRLRNDEGRKGNENSRIRKICRYVGKRK